MNIQTNTRKINFLQKIFGKEHTIDAPCSNINFRCPNKKCGSHIKNKLKFVVKIDNSIFNCWVCGLKGKDLSNIIKNIEKDFDKNSLVKEYYDIWDNLNIKDSQIEQEIKQDFSLPKDFRLLAELIETKQNKFKHNRIISFLKTRKVSIEDLWYYKIGVSDEPDYRDRIVFPSFDENGKCDYCLTRKLYDSNYKYNNLGKKPSEIIYNEFNCDFTKHLYIFEGVFDLIRANVNGTCLLGSYLTEKSKLFHKILFNNTSVTICLDGDALDKSIKICDLLYKHGIDVNIIELENGLDPGSIEKEDLELILKQKKRFNKLDYLLNKIKNIKTVNFI
jgi:DNA primase